MAATCADALCHRPQRSTVATSAAARERPRPHLLSRVYLTHGRVETGPQKAQWADFIPPARFSAGMERLPDELLLVILHKLAALDPLSLLRISCALAPFYRVAAENPDLWKEAFCGSTNEVGESIFPKQFLNFDAEVQALGGYKRLLMARYYCHSAARKEYPPEQSQAGVEESEDICECALRYFWRRPELGGMTLSLLRLNGSIWMWGIYPKTKSETVLRMAPTSNQSSRAFCFSSYTP